ncbi:MAG: ATP-dependent RNA helicase HrpA [Zoogloeaceae bacterium]|nr:ATP-dependent RNA helicase HrpA [Zoogloeaceae bacterium]
MTRSIANTRPALPQIDFDEALPVNARREEIARAIAAHQVVVVCGETGSGKTTQLPKICLQLGRGRAGLIGHTQPRRIAARATATRIAQELKSELGRYVGYKIRFTDRTSHECYIKLMTDGILLAETQTDPLLRQYDTLIIDEAHERSLNIDFLLGFLKQLLPKRPELKIIITSATLDAERFSRHFGAAPVIEVSGRLFPIETRYRPYGEDDDRDVNDAIADATGEAQRTGAGDVLVFLSGEREIREAAEALRKHHPPGLEILPLFARQSAQEQARVFAPHQGCRVILATNVAETSLTVPGIRYVIDTGLARVKRYSHRNKVEQLQVENISQAAAKQRQGRCGRVAAGVCFRLYAEDDFIKRPPHTDPEILRSSLAGVILRMKALHLGDIEAFPFLEPPLPRMCADGYQLLAELGALDEVSKELTPVGHELAKLPLDPKIGRMILAARQYGCLKEMLVIAAALSVQDPRERPQEQTGTADQAHARWKDEKSEFLSYLKLWAAADEIWKHESNNKQRQWCRREFLSWLRLREWRDVHGQLHTLCTEHGWRENQQAANYEAIHKALLTGLLGHIGLRNEEDKSYYGARGIKFFIHPGSAQVKKAGRWIVAAELVETSRLFARCVAQIQPEWLEETGAHLIRKHVFEPHWEKGAGQVVAWERVTLHGLLLHAKRRVHYGPMDVKLSREILIRHALVLGEVSEDWLRQWRFLQHNRKLVAEIERLEHKSRRPDVLVDEALIHAIFDAKVPAGITSLAAFDKWRREAEAQEPKLLFLEKEQLMRHEAAGITTDAFPPDMEHKGQSWRFTYKHDPGAADDGVTLAVPLTTLNRVPATRCEWLVSGLLQEKIAALLKTLPQKYRHRLQPLDAFAEDFCDAGHDQDEALVKALTRAVEEKIALKLPLDAFRSGELRPHLSMNFRLQDEHGGTLALSRNLAELRAEYGDFAEPSEEQAAEQERDGLRARFTAALKEQLKSVDKNLPRELTLQFIALGTEKEFKEQITAVTLTRTCLFEPQPDSDKAFEARLATAKGKVVLVAQEVARLAATILAEHAALQKKLTAMQKAFPQTCADIAAQAAALLAKNFIAATPYERLAHFPRYLKAATLRLDKARADAPRDIRLMTDWQTLARPWQRERNAMTQSGITDPFLEEFRWLLEELRVALFAQELKTPSPVSVKRLQKMWEGRGRA